MSTVLDPLKSALREHRLYSLISDEDAVRFFMERHVLCVWDFMSLVKSLQRELAPTGTPWLPSEYGLATRLINEIVLDEESDTLPGGGGYGSHYELYISAMDELGCDTGPMTAVIDALRAGASLEQALAASSLPSEAKQFTRVTFELLEQPLHVRAAVFLHGREDMIPEMFINFVQSLKAQNVPCSLFLDYLERHIEVDADRHRPMAHQMMLQLCGDSAGKWGDAEQAAQKALKARLALWDEVASQLEALHSTVSSAPRMRTASR